MYLPLFMNSHAVSRNLWLRAKTGRNHASLPPLYAASPPPLIPLSHGAPVQGDDLKTTATRDYGKCLNVDWGHGKHFSQPQYSTYLAGIASLLSILGSHLNFASNPCEPRD